MRNAKQLACLVAVPQRLACVAAMQAAPSHAEATATAPN